MKYKTVILTILASLILLIAGCIQPASKTEVSPILLTPTEAVGIAREHCKGKMNLPTGVTPVIEETDTTIIVTFPTDLPPHTFGPDYHAKVTIDRKTRKVTAFMVGS